MDLQIESEHINPIVTLKDGTRHSRARVLFLQDSIRKMSLIENGAVLLNELIAKCENPEHDFFPGSQWRLAELGLLETDGQVFPSIREILRAVLDLSGPSVRFNFPFSD